jgi:hypothetical protein
MSNLARYVTFTLHPHDNADSLSIAHIDGTDWQCVTQTSQWAGGPTAGIYIGIDALVDPARPEFVFLASKASKKFADGRLAHRIKTMRLRGKLSQGLLIPLLPGYSNDTQSDWAGLLGIERYEPPTPTQLSGDQIRCPGSFRTYTSIENAKNHPNALVEGEMVRVTEKAHGCLAFSTPITMADGTTRNISSLVANDEVGAEVMGVDSGGMLVATKITKVFNNGHGTEWVKVIGKRRGAGRGNSIFAIVCTPNHKFWSKDRYVAASELQSGDRVTLIRSEGGLTPIQRQVLIGKMLGDGTLTSFEYSASLEFGHKAEHEEYVNWTCRALGEIARPSRRTTTSGYGTEMIRASTVSSGHIKAMLDTFLVGSDKKYIPDWVADEIGPIALAFWYMDDGSLNHNEDQEDRAAFAVCNFEGEDCAVLVRAFRRFGINATAALGNDGSDKYWRMRLSADESEKFFLLIAPYVPPVMQYKLPKRYRGHPGWLPADNTPGYKPMLVEQDVVSVESFMPERLTRYDLETEAHNFFANSVLVHNSNSRVGFVDDGREAPVYMVGTHATARDPAGGNLYSTIARRDMPEAKLLEVLTSLGLSPVGKQHAIVFFEIFGFKVQDLQYGCAKNEQKVCLFDVCVDDVFQPFETVQAVAAGLGLKTAPVLYRGPYSRTTVMALRDGKTTIGGDHVREGVVVTAEPEVRFIGDDGGSYRKILKFISDDYLLRSGEKDGH